MGCGAHTNSALPWIDGPSAADSVGTRYALLQWIGQSKTKIDDPHPKTGPCEMLAISS